MGALGILRPMITISVSRGPQPRAGFIYSTSAKLSHSWAHRVYTMPQIMLGAAGTKSNHFRHRSENTGISRKFKRLPKPSLPRPMMSMPMMTQLMSMVAMPKLTPAVSEMPMASVFHALVPTSPALTESTVPKP